MSNATLNIRILKKNRKKGRLRLLCCSSASASAQLLPSTMEIDGNPTRTSDEQRSCEEECFRILKSMENIKEDEKEELYELGFLDEKDEISLLRSQHIKYLTNLLSYPLPKGFSCLNASRPWMCYWILQSLDLLGAVEVKKKEEKRIIDFLKHCSNSGTGGYGGGPQQLSHTATTYASVLALAILGSENAFKSIDRDGIYKFYMSLKDPITCAFAAHKDGEVDVRTTFCVICIADLLNLLTDELIFGVVDYVLRCQSYEGGFGPEPAGEAHGGYTFCSVAILYLLNSLHLCDIDTLLYWIAHRQMSVEGGYQGRTNKLVDGCYSFWQGAVPIMIWNYLKSYDVKNSEESGNTTKKPVLEEDMPVVMDRQRLQQYILVCAQYYNGGLLDKPGKRPDSYHSCYCLSGLSLAQYGDEYSQGKVIYGSTSNLLNETHFLYNIPPKQMLHIKEYFKTLNFRIIQKTQEEEEEEEEEEIDYL